MHFRNNIFISKHVFAVIWRNGNPSSPPSPPRPYRRCGTHQRGADNCNKLTPRYRYIHIAFPLCGRRCCCWWNPHPRLFERQFPTNKPAARRLCGEPTRMEQHTHTRGRPLECQSDVARPTPCAPALVRIFYCVLGAFHLAPVHCALVMHLAWCAHNLSNNEPRTQTYNQIRLYSILYIYKIYFPRQHTSRG